MQMHEDYYANDSKQKFRQCTNIKMQVLSKGLANNPISINSAKAISKYKLPLLSQHLNESRVSNLQQMN